MTPEEKDPRNSRCSAHMPVTLSGSKRELKYRITTGTGLYLLNRVDFPPSKGLRLRLCFCTLLTVRGLHFIWVFDTSPCKEIRGAFLGKISFDIYVAGMCITRIGPNKQKVATCSQSQVGDL